MFYHAQACARHVANQICAADPLPAHCSLISLALPRSAACSASHSICILAGDISPVDVITHIPIVCEDNKIPYIFVPSKEVGAAVMVAVAAAAAAAMVAVAAAAAAGSAF